MKKLLILILFLLTACDNEKCKYDYEKYSHIYEICIKNAKDISQIIIMTCDRSAINAAKYCYIEND